MKVVLVTGCRADTAVWYARAYGTSMVASSSSDRTAFTSSSFTMDENALQTWFSPEQPTSLARVLLPCVRHPTATATTTTRHVARMLVARVKNNSGVWYSPTWVMYVGDMAAPHSDTALHGAFADVRFCPAPLSLSLCVSSGEGRLPHSRRCSRCRCRLPR
jgi:hypothetical protein